MSRSYHVTKRAAVRAFVVDHDTDLAEEASDKAGVKRRERLERGRDALGFNKRRPNRRTVAAERALTRAVRKRRGES